MKDIKIYKERLQRLWVLHKDGMELGHINVSLFHLAICSKTGCLASACQPVTTSAGHHVHRNPTIPMEIVIPHISGKSLYHVFHDIYHGCRPHSHKSS